MLIIKIITMMMMMMRKFAGRDGAQPGCAAINRDGNRSGDLS
jgi:hypothetical protein